MPRHFLLAALIAAALVAVGDVLLAAHGQSDLPSQALHSALFAAIGLYAVPAFFAGAIEAWIADSLLSLFGRETLMRARRSLHEPGTDAALSAGILAALCVLLLDAGLLYVYLRVIGFEMANRRNGALSTAMVAVGALPLLALLGPPIYRITRRLVGLMPRPRLLFTFGLLTVFGLVAVALALMSVDWRIIHFGPSKALGCFLVLEAVAILLLGLGRGGLRAARDGVLLLLFCGLSLFAAVYTLYSFGAEPRSRALIAEQSAGAGFLLKGARALLDHDGDGYSPRLGGGDCDDHDPNVHPGAEDLPGNGRDEDCDGQDAEAVPEEPVKPAAAAGAPLGAAPAGSPPAAAAASAIAPSLPPGERWDGNWLIITIDTLRADRIKAEVAPNLMSLAERGVRFTNIYAQAPNTPRSFPSFVTSRLPSEVHFVKQAWNFSPLTGKDPTLFTALSAAGYHNVGVFSHFYLEQKTGLSGGFAEWNNAGAKNLHDSNSDISAPRITQAVIDKLKQLAAAGKAAGASPQRFVLWTHLFDPHSTYMDHPEFPVSKGWKYMAQRYDAEVSFTDRHVGLILSALRDAGLAERTAVVVFSDHGEAFGEHKLGGEPLYFHGEALYNEVLRVPLIVYVPGRPARIIDERASLLDVAPTVLELSGVAVPETFHGRSLAPLLLGTKRDEPADTTKPAPPPAIAEMLPCTAWPKNERVIVDSIDGVDYALYSKYTDNLTELYNLRDDPTQQKNLASSDPAKVHELQKRLAPYLHPRR